MHTRIKTVIILMVANLCIGCGALTNGGTWTIGSYEKTDEDTNCSNETYNNSTCSDEINPFSNGIKISITNSALNLDGDRYHVSEDSQVLVHNSNDELLYESSLI